MNKDCVMAYMIMGVGCLIQGGRTGAPISAFINVINI